MRCCCLDPECLTRSIDHLRRVGAGKWVCEEIASAGALPDPVVAAPVAQARGKVAPAAGKIGDLQVPPGIQAHAELVRPAPPRPVPRDVSDVVEEGHEGGL